MTVERRDPLLAFLGGAIMGVGALIAALCGSCTVLFGIGVVSDAMAGRGQSPELRIDLPTVLLIGGIPTLIGLGLFLGGRAMYRAGARPRDKAAHD